MVTFFNPVKDGWLLKKADGAALSKWRRRWFLLNDNCLYYFLDPTHEINDASPRGIYPLDGTIVQKIGSDRLRLARCVFVHLYTGHGCAYLIIHTFRCWRSMNVCLLLQWRPHAPSAEVCEAGSRRTCTRNSYRAAAPCARWRGGTR